MSQSHRKHENPYIDYEHRTTRLEGAIENINLTLIRIDERLDRMENRLDRIELRIDTIDKKIDSSFRWLLGVILAGWGITITSFAGIFGIMAHGFHWIQ